MMEIKAKYVNYIGPIQNKVLDVLSDGKKHTTVQIIKRLYDYERTESRTYQRIFHALKRLEKRDIVQTELKDGEEFGTPRGKEKNRPRRQIRYWWLEF